MREWKRETLVSALARAGVETEVGALVDAHGEGRRRATFHARVPADVGRDEVGFMRARAHEIVDIDACPLFSPGMAGAVAAARALAADLRGSTSRSTSRRPRRSAASISTFAAAGRSKRGDAQARRDGRVARSGAGVAAWQRRDRATAREVAFGAARVAICPAGGFLQATIAGESALAARAPAALKGARRVADLFCGAGAFALRLARRP